MQFFQPDDIRQAVRLLANEPQAACLAGGAVLVAKMNRREATPTRLVSLRRLGGLGDLLIEAGGATIGAMVSHAVVARAAALAGGHELVREAAGQIAHPGIRSMATIGGSVAEADPQSDYPCALLGAGAAVVIEGPGGRRVAPVDGFFVGPFKTALARGEIIIAVSLAPRTPQEGSAHEKFSRVDGDYATAAVAVRLRLELGVCTAVRIAIGGCGPVPFRVAAAEQALVGTAIDGAEVTRVASLYVEACAPADDVKGSADYRRMLIPGLLKRAVHRARRRAAGAA